MIPVNKVAHGIGMQNQYLYGAVVDGKIEGVQVPGHDYHSDDALVDIDSVRDYVKWKFKNWIISKERRDCAIAFLDTLRDK